jgi:hypothetical protein
MKNELTNIIPLTLKGDIASGRPSSSIQYTDAKIIEHIIYP